MKLPIIRQNYLVDCLKRQKKLPFVLYKIEALGETSGSGVVTAKVKGRGDVHEASGLQDTGHILLSSIEETTGGTNATKQSFDARGATDIHDTSLGSSHSVQEECNILRETLVKIITSLGRRKLQLSKINIQRVLFKAALVRLLTEKNINVRAMKSKLEDVWKPVAGINIKEIGQEVFLFQFFRKEDMNWVMSGGPWSFDNVMLALKPVAPGEDSTKVQTWFLNIWIQLYNLPMGYMLKSVGRQLENFFGEFLEYDSKNNAFIWRDCVRVRIRLDVCKPIKRKKKIRKRDGSEFVDEETRLQLEERKRRRGDIVMNQGSDGRGQLNGSVISGRDLAAPGNNVLAELARQASHQP
ncbi:hypothetical protein AgCh_018172 [Apium graveolens]